MEACRLFIDGRLADDVEYAEDESEVGGPIARQPMLADAYEQRCCEVRPSTLGPEAGEGLFARIDLPPGVVVSFYNGVKQEERIVSPAHHGSVLSLAYGAAAMGSSLPLCVFRGVHRASRTTGT